MDLKIDKVHGRDELKNERLLVHVEKDCNLGDYIVFDSTFDSALQLTNLHRHSYLFDDIKVKQGDSVVLYTKVGDYGTKRKYKEEGRKELYHFVYMNLDKQIWNNEGDCAFLIKVAEWSKPKAV